MIDKFTAHTKYKNCCQYITSFLYQTIFNYGQNDDQKAIRILFPSNFQHCYLDHNKKLRIAKYDPNNMTADYINHVYQVRLRSILVERNKTKSGNITWTDTKMIRHSKEFTDEIAKLKWARDYLLTYF